jgi:hypothetical protein
MPPVLSTSVLKRPAAAARGANARAESRTGSAQHADQFRSLLSVSAKDDPAVVALKVIMSRMPQQKLRNARDNARGIKNFTMSSGCTGSKVDVMMATLIFEILKVPAQVRDIFGAESVPHCLQVFEVHLV